MEILNQENLKKYLSREFLFFESITSTFDAFGTNPKEVEQAESPINSATKLSTQSLAESSAKLSSHSHPAKPTAESPPAKLTAPPDIVVAAQQTGGKGRFDRQFYSPKGGIYFCIKTAIRPMLTINAAAGVMRAMQKSGLSPEVKWVNDIMLSGKKVCGILAKSDGKRATIGVGINYCINEFPQEISARAGSMRKFTDGINHFAALAITQVLAAVGDSRMTSDNLQFYKNRLCGIGQKITLPSGDNAIMLGITDDGSLLYDKDEKTGTLCYGEIML